MPQEQVQFGIRKLAAIVVIFAAMFALVRDADGSRVLLGCIVASCLSGMVVVGKLRDLVPCLRVVGGCVAGVVFGGMCCAPFHSSAEGIAFISFCAFLGGLITTLFNAAQRGPN